MHKKQKSRVRYCTGRNDCTIRVCLPEDWVVKMGINPTAKEIMLTFDSEKIIIEKATKKRLGKWRKKTV